MPSPRFPVWDAPVAGMMLGATAYSLFAFHDAMVKLLVVAGLPVVQILLARSIVVAAATLALGRGALLREAVESKRKGLLLARAALTLGAWTLYYVNGSQMQLAEMTTLYYAAPLMTLVLAMIFLGERLTAGRATATALGFAGVVVACNPAGIAFGVPAMMVLTAALLWGVAMILMRTISKSESSLLLVFSMNAIYVVVLTPIVVLSFVPMSATDLALVLGVALCGGAGQFVLVEAARRIPASVLGTVEYSALIWSFLLGALIFAELPAPAVYAGAALIVMAGVVLAWTERRQRRLA
jgi:drug/metabolite transporter (DMT)-like permease